VSGGATAGASRGGRGGRPADGKVRPSARDLELLRFVGEQYAVTLLQLARLMGRSLHAARWLRARWERAGWARGRSLLVGEPVLVWATRRGLRLAGLDYRAWRPNPGMVRHIAAVNEVRLFVRERRPEADWVCERELARDGHASANGGHRPHAVAVVDGREVAVEVDLTHKRRRRTERIVTSYGSVWYFAAARPRRAIEQVAERVGGGRVQVLPLPGEEDAGR
jgi:hypothetical protein